MIISAYAISNTSTNCGALTYSSQLRRIQGNNFPEITPKRLFWNHLAKFVNETNDRNIQIILGIDANSNIDSHQSDIGKFLQETNLRDPISELNSGQCNSPTYIYGSNRIDGISLSNELLQTTHSADVIPNTDIIDTDHHGIIIDMYMDKTFSMRKEIDNHNRVYPSINSPSSISKYNRILSSLLKSQNIATRLQDLHVDLLSRGVTKEATARFNSIDKKIMKFQLLAAKKCTPSLSALPWSPKLTEIRRKTRILRRIIRRSPYEIPAQLHAVCRDLGIDISISQSDAISLYKKCHQKHKQIKINAKQLRMEFLQRRADFHSSHSNTKSSIILKRIIHAEMTRDVHRQIRYRIRDNERTEITQLRVPVNNNKYIQIDDTEEIHNRILNSTEDLRNEINHLPVSSHRFLKYIGWYGDKSGVDEILNGKMRMECILKNLATPTTYKPNLVDPYISPGEFRDVIRATRENTMASPSGVGYAHYIASTYDEILNEIMALRTSLPFVFPMSVYRWQKANHILIPKTTHPTISKLRNIQLIEADYNSYYKVKVNNQLLRLQYPQTILNDQMYGGLRGKSTHMALANQILIND